MDNVYNTAAINDAHGKPGGTASLLRVILVVSVAMQLTEKHRLQGRHLGKCVEDFLYATSGSREPCVSLAQALLLLLVLRITEASDTDSISSSMGVQGLTSQVVLSVGLHRDPDLLFPGESTYRRDTRKRLWACYLRLSLDYSVRTGTPFPVHLEDTDCPLPAATRISRLDVLPPSPFSRCDVDPESEEADAVFGLAAAKLARTLVPMQRALCSSVPKASQCELSMQEIGATFDSYIADAPPSLKIDCAAKTPTNAILMLQRSILSINMHSITLVVALRNILCEPPDPSQKAQMMEVWDHAISILDVFQNLLQLGDQRGPEATAAADIAHQLLWPDAVRAALYGCILVGRMRRLDGGRMLWSGAARNNTIATVCQSLLSAPLSFMCRFWQRRFHLGPVATKVSLLLAVALTVTSNLDGASGDGAAAGEWTQDSKQRFMLMGVTVVDEWVAGMKAAFEARRREDRGAAAAAAASALLLEAGTAGLSPSPSHNNVLPVTASSALGGTPYGEIPTHARIPSLSPSLATDSGFGDFDFNPNGIFGQGFEFDSVEWFMMQAMGEYGHDVSLSPTTQSSGLE
ncbi:putative c6 transcription [Diaporthe ampelina]|uniref:Putative c6 transcription n=1 Tax=Diaporthe ampelina TaxID=1214573 RepID=A0A0G2HQN1_9PEZI|nr:putative c6 transcription [Diaporthe ampelina]